MNISKYVEFINESFDSSKLTSVFNYIKSRKNDFIYTLKTLCSRYDIKLSYVNDDMFEYISYVELKNEIKNKTHNLPNTPFIVFGFDVAGNYEAYFVVENLTRDLDRFTNDLDRCNFFLIFSTNVGESKKGLSKLKEDRIESRRLNKTENVFDKLGKMDPEDISKITKQLKRIYGGEYPFFYMCYHHISPSDLSNIISFENLNERGHIKRIHDFNISLIKKLAENRKNKHVIKFLEINNHIKKKLESFFIESYDDVYSYVSYLTSIGSVCQNYDLYTYITRFMEYETYSRARPNSENIDTALKIIKKI